jgi:hypothetical protein
VILKPTRETEAFLADLTPEQLQLYHAAELEWQADLDAYIRDWKNQFSDYLRSLPPESQTVAYPAYRPAAPRCAGRKKA